MRNKQFLIPLITVSSLLSSTAYAGVEVPADGPCCYGTAAWDNPKDMPLVDQAGNAYVYDPNSTLMAGTCASGTSANGFVFGVTDISDQANAVIGTDWGLSTVNVGIGSNEAPMYHHPHWTRDFLGEVFGIAYGPDGAIYLTATEVFPTIGTNTGGEVWRIDPTTGEPSLLVALPQDPNNHVGLGNITYDCAHDQLLVTNFFDGGIYRIDPNTGAILSSITHWELVTGVPANPADIWSTTQAGHVPKLAVPWGIAVWGEYVYYGTWQNGQFPQVYAVKLDGSGDFIPATHELEMTEGDPGWDNYGGGVSPSDPNAVSDIAFKQGRMMIAERGQQALHSTQPHVSRIYEWEYIAGDWVRTLDVNAVSREFHVAAGGSSVSGGTAYDYDNLVDPDAPDGRVWATADCITDPNAPGFTGCDSYGAYGVQADGNRSYFLSSAHNAHAIFVDYDRDQLAQDKQFVGDVELTCKAAPVDDVDCLTAANEIIDCGTGQWLYDWEVTFTNDSDFPISTIHFTTDPLDPTVEVGVNVGDNNTVNLPSPLAPGDSVSVNLGINAPNAEGGDELCFDLKVTDEDEAFCCSEEVVEFCVTLPDCRECNNSIVGIKFYDKNGNGVWDANDTPLPNWTINLLYPNGTTTSVVTDYSGGFIFDHVPADVGYQLFETQQLGWVQTLPGGAPAGYNVDFTDPNGTTEVLYFGNDKGGIIIADPVEQLVIEGDAKDVVVVDLELPAQALDLKLRGAVVAVDDQDPSDRLQSLRVVADLDGDGEVDSLDPVLGSATVDAGGSLINIEFAEPVELAADTTLRMLVVADFGEAVAADSSSAAAAGIVFPWWTLGFGLGLGLVVLGAGSLTRRRRPLTWATAGLAVGVTLTVGIACAPEQEPAAAEGYRFGVIKVVATEVGTGHYGHVDGVEGAVSPWVVIRK